MYPHWTEMRSYGHERLQQFIAEADEHRLAQRVAPASPAPLVRQSMWQTLAATIRRFTTPRARRATALATR
jgi:hypothetical protein